MKHIPVIVALCAVSAGCTTFRTYERPAEVSAPEGLFGDSVVTGDTATIASVPWHEFFTDSYLQALIDSAMANNADLAVAQLRVAEAEATLKAGRMAYLPSVSFNGQGTAARYGSDGAPGTYSLGLSAEWEPDITGRITAQKRGAEAALMQERCYRQAVSAQLVATVANSYYSLLALDSQIDISRRSLGAWDDIIRTLGARKEAGESNAAAVAQARASRMEVENTILKLTQQIRATENSLCMVLGRVPGHIERGDLMEQTSPDTLAVGVPLQMLDNRPDVRQAEYALQAAFYATNVARAAFYPSLTLSGAAGWTNSSGAAIVNPGELLLSAVGSLVQPLFNRGRNKANLEIARARQQEALITFRQKLLEAGADVNDALTQWQTAGERLRVSASRIEELEEAVRCTRLLMTYSDSGSYLEVLTAQQTLLSAQLTAAQQTFDRLQGVVKLYHALGGGR